MLLQMTEKNVTKILLALLKIVFILDFLMFAGTFTASMKNTNLKTTYMQNKQLRHLQQTRAS